MLTYFALVLGAVIGYGIGALMTAGAVRRELAKPPVVLGESRPAEPEELLVSVEQFDEEPTQ